MTPTDMNSMFQLGTSAVQMTSAMRQRQKANRIAILDGALREVIEGRGPAAAEPDQTEIRPEVDRAASDGNGDGDEDRGHPALATPATPAAAGGG